MISSNKDALSFAVLNVFQHIQCKLLMCWEKHWKHLFQPRSAGCYC